MSSSQERARIHAPELAPHLEGRTSHNDIAAQAVADAERVYKRVAELRLGPAETKLVIAEAIFYAARKQRQYWPEQERQLEAALLQGVRAHIVSGLDNYISRLVKK